MPEPTLPAGDSFLLSPRTASYIVALIREGDNSTIPSGYGG